MQQGDTISAIATPQGEGGIGVIRISGEHALKTAVSYTHLTLPTT